MRWEWPTVTGVMNEANGHLMFPGVVVIWMIMLQMIAFQFSPSTSRLCETPSDLVPIFKSIARSNSISNIVVVVITIYLYYYPSPSSGILFLPVFLSIFVRGCCIVSSDHVGHHAVAPAMKAKVSLLIISGTLLAKGQG